ncbi:DUF2505 domain-containing protein [Nocardioides euryhalodurans]|uniref:DUF2505 domain-containing protein n=1 Tax=Nocardioides euryhalodurans TaxID=2518370 RepID=A0A4P7GP44_9ACTN|nr:DUF2505 domain-containing protein [Nocardioides euryhalodurans]QBR93724.1 DUF2505 domain-containing protein [Nocardioides euryhalodurans]
MAKRITHDLTYDAPLAEVAALLADADFRREVCARQGNLRSEVTVVPEGSGKHVTIDQFQAADGLPSFARKFVGDEIHIVQTERWSTDDAADVTVTIPGKPGDMSGTAHLVESGGVTTETVDLTIKVGIPLVGGKIEGLIADLLLKALKTENVVGREWLAR